MATIELTTVANIPSGASLDVTVYEDVDQDGTADNQATQAIDDGTNTYSLTGFSGGTGSDYWLDQSYSNSDTSVTAHLDSAEIDTSVWQTTADWDSAQSETGVHHEQPSGTDWAASDTIEKGFPTSDPGGTALTGYWPCDEDSGTTFADVSGANNDMTLNGDPAVSATGVLGTTCGKYDGTGDYIKATGVNSNSSAFTAAFLIYATASDSNGVMMMSGGSTTSWPSSGWTFNFDSTSTDMALWYHDGSNNKVLSLNIAGHNAWYLVCIKTNGGQNSGEARIYDSSGLVTSGTGTGGRTTSSTNPVFCMQGNSNYVSGRIDEPRIWSRELSDAECDDIHSAVF